jgi:hypothetical protein
LASAGTNAVKGSLIKNFDFIRMLCEFVPLSNATALNVLLGLCELIKWEQRLEAPAPELVGLIIDEGLIDLDALEEQFTEIEMDDWTYSETLEKFKRLLDGDDTFD